MGRMNSAATRPGVDEFIRVDAIPHGPEFPCPYLQSRTARYRCFVADDVSPASYRALLDRRFRRSGRIFYQPDCPGCAECKQLRVLVADFKPSRSQRRIQRLNADLVIRVGKPQLTPEKWRLYARYLELRHDGTMSDKREDLHDFLFQSPVDSIEIDYFLQDRLVGVSIADRTSEMLSSVYMYFDPSHARRSLGTFSALWEIDYCRRSHIPYYYFGFYIRNCSKMSYKAGFRPCEVLTSDYQWVRIDESASEVGQSSDGQRAAGFSPRESM